MKKIVLITCLSIFSTFSFAQIAIDTLNKFNSNKQKNGYWISYLDSCFNKTTKENAKYYGYDHYINGKAALNNFAKSKWKLSSRIVYKPYFTVPSEEYPILLDGEVFYYDKKTPTAYESYSKGRLTVIKDVYERDSIKSSYEIFYFDSLYNNTPHTIFSY